MRQNREFLMLSEKLDPNQIHKFSLGNWYASEKLDGQRAIWLPDTRGIRISELPFANLERDRSNSGTRAATGLWSRYARPIFAPAAWLDGLPNDIPLDGELWIGRRQFQRLSSVVREHNPGPGWSDVRYYVFDSPCYRRIYQDGKIHNGVLKKRFTGIFEWMRQRIPFDYPCHGHSFDHVYHQILCKRLEGNPIATCHPQEVLPWRHSEAVDRIKVKFDEVLAQGGEGLIIRAPHSQWEPIRSKLVLKYKPLEDAEGTVIGFNPGEGRLEGMIGSLQVRAVINGRTIEFGLSGLTDSERAFPSTTFSVGTVVTFVYRELTEEGIPREARFSRLRVDL